MKKDSVARGRAEGVEEKGASEKRVDWKGSKLKGRVKRGKVVRWGRWGEDFSVRSTQPRFANTDQDLALLEEIQFWSPKAPAQARGQGFPRKCKAGGNSTRMMTARYVHLQLCHSQTSWHITKIEILKSNLNNVQKRSCGVQHPVDLVVPNAEPRVATVLASQGMGLYVFLALWDDRLPQST